MSELREATEEIVAMFGAKEVCEAVAKQLGEAVETLRAVAFKTQVVGFVPSVLVLEVTSRALPRAPTSRTISLFHFRVAWCGVRPLARCLCACAMLAAEFAICGFANVDAAARCSACTADAHCPSIFALSMEWCRRVGPWRR